MRVKRQLENWPEMHDRKLRWCAVPEAVKILRDSGLARLVGDLRKPRSGINQSGVNKSSS